MTTTDAPHAATDQRYPRAEITADPEVPAIHIVRDFRGTPAQLVRAHTDPALFARWVGPDELENEILEWDARSGGSWRYVARQPGSEEEHFFRGCFHTVGPDRIVQTFTWEGMPDDVSLETLTFTELGDGTTRLHAMSLCDSFTGRDQWLASGMEYGIHPGYAAIDAMLADGTLDDAS